MLLEAVHRSAAGTPKASRAMGRLRPCCLCCPGEGNHTQMRLDVRSSTKWPERAYSCCAVLSNPASAAALKAGGGTAICQVEQPRATVRDYCD